MSYYPKPDSHISNKVKVVLNLTNYATKNELEDAAGVDGSNLAARKDLIALWAEVDKLDINKLVNVLSGLNNLKTKVDNVDSCKLNKLDIIKLVNVLRGLNNLELK